MLKKMLDIFFNIIYPPRCLVCKKDLLANYPDRFMCIECVNKIKKNIPPFCIYCARHIENNELPICKNCKDKTYYFDRAFSACVYEGVIKEIIHQFKYNQKDFLANFLSDILIGFIKTYGIGMQEFDFVVTIPLHPRKIREREYNQSLLLAESIAKEFELVLLKDALYKVRDSVSQTELNLQQRIDNVKDTFKINPKVDIKDKNILLIDDVLTTAATSSEASRVLKAAGAQKITVLTIAS